MGYKIVLPYGAITLVGDVPNRRIVPQMDCPDIRYFITITKEINRLNQIICTIRDMKEYSTEDFIHIAFTIIDVLYDIEQNYYRGCTINALQTHTERNSLWQK
ncbi:hypothetical protein DFY22_23065 [Escherichia coli]|jgi:hypothetical protein|nr:hypothetical protein [Escherichia coli]DAN63072.1 MAG TPA: hypothetical protein [Caudoviricetes sp.]EEW7528366.1 hypothetical protein [Escherichia coli]EEY4023389.1 hypothetical protein [Escherichia coli]EFO0524345.1 hypothetical protein [Escherichia coli]